MLEQYTTYDLFMASLCLLMVIFITFISIAIGKENLKFSKEVLKPTIEREQRDKNTKFVIILSYGLLCVEVIALVGILIFILGRVI